MTTYLRCPVRDAYRLRFGLAFKKARRLTNADLNQLSQCKSDEARRLILEVTRLSTINPLKVLKVHLRNHEQRGLLCGVEARGMRGTDVVAKVTCTKCQQMCGVWQRRET